MAHLAQEGPVEVSLGSVQLESKSSNVANCLRGSLLASGSRETGEKRSAFSDTIQELGRSNVGHVSGDLEVAIGTTASGVDDAMFRVNTNPLGFLEIDRALTALEHAHGPGTGSSRSG